MEQETIVNQEEVIETPETSERDTFLEEVNQIIAEVTLDEKPREQYITEIIAALEALLGTEDFVESNPALSGSAGLSLEGLNELE